MGIILKYEKHGGGGNDNITGYHPLHNKLYGGGGDDHLTAFGIKNDLYGESGNDTLVAYGIYNNLDGGTGDDYLFATGVYNNMDGGDGNDYMKGVGLVNHMDGGAGDDYMVGLGLVNDMKGGAGNDYMFGAGLVNYMDGGSGDDYMVGAGLVNNMTGGDGNDYMLASGLVNFMDGGSGDDYMMGLGLVNYMSGGEGNDYMIGSGLVNYMDGGSGDDYMVGAGLLNYMDGGSGNDVMMGLGLVNYMDGGSGDDYMVGAGLLNYMSGGSGNDVMIGTGLVNYMDGGTGDDIMFGAGLLNYMDGGSGNDVMVGAGLFNYMNGGSGNDIMTGLGLVNYMDGGSGDDYMLGAGLVNYMDGGEGNDVMLGIGLTNFMNGGSGDDIMFGLGLQNYMDGGSGDDVMMGGGVFNYINGGDGNDTILGAGIMNILIGGDGTDSIVGAGITNVISGNEKNDFIIAGGVNNLIFGNDGDDTILAGGITNTIMSGKGADFVVGGGVINTIFDESGNNTIIGGGVVNSIITGDGDDIIIGGGVTNSIVSKGGNNLVIGGGVTNTIITGAGNDTIIGGGVTNTIIAGAGKNTVIGGGVTNTIFTLDGDDLIVGGGVTNTIFGGDGENVIIGGGVDNIITAGDATVVNSDGTIIRGKNIIVGGGVTNKIISGNGDDIIIGGGVDNFIQAGDGDNIIVGGGVTNTILGGDGENIIVGGGVNNTIIAGDATVVNNDGTITRGKNIIVGGGVTNKIISGNGDDIIVGGGVTNTIDGGSGDNIIVGGGATNTIISKDGNDIIVGGGETNTITTGDGEKIIVGGGVTNTIKAGNASYVDATGKIIAGKNIIIGGGVTNEITSGNGDDIIVGGGETNTIYGGSGDNIIVGGGVTNKIYSETGKDIIVGGGNDNYIETKDGEKIIVGGGVTNEIKAGNAFFIDDKGERHVGKNIIIGGGVTNTITSGAGNDIIVGGGKDNTIHAGDGDNIVVGGGLTNKIDSGIGKDTIVGGGKDNIIETKDGEKTIVGGGVKNEIKAGNAFIIDDKGVKQVGKNIIIGGGVTNTITSGSGNDIIIGGGKDNTIHAGDGDNIVVGGGVNNRIDSGTGKDTIVGGGKTNIINTGDGEKIILGGGVDNTITAGNASVVDASGKIVTKGKNVIIGGGVNNTITSGNGDDVILGGGVTNKIYANDGDNIVIGGGVTNIITSGNGDDIIVGGGKDNSITTKNGDKTIIGGGLINTITVEDGRNIIIGGGETNKITAGNSKQFDKSGNEIVENNIVNRNIIIGGGVTNTIISGNGDDIIIGGGKINTIEAGNGDNIVVGAGLDNKITAGSGDDLITAGGKTNIIKVGDGTNFVFSAGITNNLTAGSGEDVLLTLGKHNIVNAGDENSENAGDLIVSFGDTNTINGGTGDNVIFGIGRDTRINVGVGKNIIGSIGLSKSTVTAGDGNNVIVGYSLDQSKIETLNGKNIIINIAGNNSNINTGAGDDTIFSNAKNSNISAQSGNNLIVSLGTNSNVSALEGNDIILSYASLQNSINAGDGNNIVIMSGQNGNLDTGAGKDIIFSGTTGTANINAGAGNDFIAGFGFSNMLKSWLSTIAEDSSIINQVNHSINELKNYIFSFYNQASAFFRKTDTEIVKEVGSDIAGYLGIASDQSALSASVDLWSYVLNSKIAGYNSFQGQAGNDYFVSGFGNDYFYGGEGDDAYAYYFGDGTDVINEKQSGGTDVLEFYASNFSTKIDFKAKEDFSFSVANGKDLIINITPNGGISQGKITIVDMNNELSQLEKLRIFADETTFNYQEIDLKKIFEYILAYGTINSGNEYWNTVTSVTGIGENSTRHEAKDTILTTKQDYSLSTDGSGTVEKYCSTKDADTAIKDTDSIVKDINDKVDDLIKNNGIESYIPKNLRDISGLNDDDANGKELITDEVNLKDVKYATGWIHGTDEDDNVFVAKEGYSEDTTKSKALRGDEKDNVIKGYAGDDVIYADNGEDIIFGGDGIDAINYSESKSGVDVNFYGTSRNIDSTGKTIVGVATGDQIVGVENLIGSDYADILGGDLKDNYISGGAGNDIIDGKIGFDTLDGGAGDDYIYATAGKQVIGDEENAVSVYAGAKQITGGEGNDTISFEDNSSDIAVDFDISTGKVMLKPKNANGQTINYTVSSIENVVGSEYNDILKGDNNANLLSGKDGDDTFVLTLGKDIIDGGEGLDAIDFSESTIGLDIDLDKNKIIGSETVFKGIENVIASNKSDTISDNFLENKINANSGNDIIVLGKGSLKKIIGEDGVVKYQDSEDIVSGGEGNDTYIIKSGQKSKIRITDFEVKNITEKIDLSDFKLTDTFDTFKTKYVKQVEDGLQIQINNTTIILTNVLYADLKATSFILTPTTFYGTEGTDTITTSDTNDTIFGLGGNDILCAGTGNNILSGGTGVDIFKIVENIGLRDWIEDFTLGEKIDLKLMKDVIDFRQLKWAKIGTDTIINLYGDQTIVLENYQNELKGTDFVFNLASTYTNNGTSASEYVVGSGNIFAFEGNDIITGSTGNDKIDAGSGHDIVNAGAGDDNVIGGLGNDELYGEAGNDILEGGLGDDKLFGGDGNDTLKPDFGINFIDGGAGVDTIDLSLASLTASYVLNNIYATSKYYGYSVNEFSFYENRDHIFQLTKTGQETYTVTRYTDTEGVLIDLTGSYNTGIAIGRYDTQNVENVVGSELNDTIIGNGLGNNLAGGLGDDYFEVIGGKNVIDGGAGIDTVSYSNQTNFVYVDLISQVASLGISAKTGDSDVVKNIENVIGTNFDDQIKGDNNNNIIEGGAGEDIIDGGEGNDWVSYEHSNQGVVVDISNSKNKLTFAGDAKGDYLTSIENVKGTNYNDTIVGNDGDNIISSGYGNNTITGGLGKDIFVIQARDLKNQRTKEIDIIKDFDVTKDKLDLSVFFKEFVALKQLDISEDKYGNTIINLYNKQQIKLDGVQKNTLTNDNFIFDSSVFNSNYHTENLIRDNNALGTPLNDEIYLNQEFNVWHTPFGTMKWQLSANMNSGFGDDVIHGAGGNDTLVGGSENDLIYGLNGNDTIYGYSKLDAIQNVIPKTDKDILFGGAGDDTIYGQYDNDILYGGSGNDALYGGEGSDVLYGEEGNDFLDGGIGNNILNGGAGNDVFVIENKGKLLKVGKDIIEDFAIGQDKIDLTKFSYYIDMRQLDIKQVGANTVINLSKDQMLILENIKATDLTNADFTFDLQTQNLTEPTQNISVDNHWDDNLMAYYSLDGNAKDVSFNTNDGTVTGATLTTDRFGVANSAYSFDGVNDSINVNKLNSVEYAQWTFGMWINRKSDSGTYERLIQQTGAGYGKYLQIGTNDVLQIGFSDSAGVNRYVSGNTLISLNNWHYVVGTFDGTNLSIFVNGVLDKTIAQPYVPQSTINNPVYIGALGSINSISSYNFNGSIDDVQIYNKALTDSEIKDLYSNGSNIAFGEEAVGLGNVYNITTPVNVFNGSSYYLTAVGNLWQSQAEAVEKGGNLVTINSLEENDFIYNKFFTGPSLWIGINDAEQEGVWKWLSGEPVSYTNWRSGEPNNYKGNEDGVEFYGQWNDISVNTVRQGVIEVKNTLDKILETKNIDNYKSSDVINFSTLGSVHINVKQEGLDTSFYIIETCQKIIIKNTVLDNINFNNFIGDAQYNFIGYKNLVPIYGTNGVDVLKGNNSNDEIYGLEGNDQLYGEFGNDILSGGVGSDLLFGGTGDDTFIYSLDDVWKIGDEAYNGGSPDHIIDGETIETVALVSKYKTYDVIDGGEGYDTLKLTDNSDGILLDDYEIQVQQAGPRLISIEKIEAGKGDDVVDLTSAKYSFGDIEINGGEGSDVIWASSGNDLIHGDEGSDEINGGSGEDKLYGDIGDDIIYGGIGNDYLFGGEWDDILYGEEDKDVLNGGTGNDKLSGGEGNDILYGEEGNDILDSGSGSNKLYGGVGKDVLIASDGVYNILNGGEDADKFVITRRENAELDSNGLIVSDLIEDFEYKKENILASNIPKSSKQTGGSSGICLSLNNKYPDLSNWLVNNEPYLVWIDSVTGKYNSLLTNVNNNPRFNQGQGTTSVGFFGNKYLNYGDRLDLKMTNNFSVGVYFCPVHDLAQQSNYGIIVSRAGEWEIARFADGSIRWAFANNTLSNNTKELVWINTGYYVQDREYVYLNVTYDNGLVKTYANGVLVHTLKSEGIIGDYNTVQNEFWIGGSQSENQYFEGWIDNIKVYDITLAEEQVVSIVNDVIGSNNLKWRHWNLNGDKIDLTFFNEYIDIQSIPYHYDEKNNLVLDLRPDQVVILENIKFEDLTNDNFIFSQYNSAESGDYVYYNTIIDNGKYYGDKDKDGANDFMTGTGEIYSRNGNDYVLGSSSNDTIDGGAGNDFLSGDGGNDTLDGRAGTDSLNGGAGNDLLYGGSENDNLFGATGDDKLYGDEGSDRLVAGDGNDELYGGNSKDILKGDAGNDKLYGNEDTDILYGGAGDDILNGGSGDDVLYGGEGADVFVIEKNKSDKDIIKDFDLTKDKINIKDAFPDFIDVLQLDMEQDGNNVIIHFENEQDITLEGKNIASLTNNHFVFNLASFAIGTVNNDLINMTTAGIVNANAGNDEIFGTDGADIIFGAEGNDVIHGKAGDDRISGDLSLFPDFNTVADYSFSGNAKDSSGNANDGTVNGATLTKDRFGNENSAYSFDGVDDYFDIPIANNNLSSSKGSISIWFDLTTVRNQESNIFSITNNTSNVCTEFNIGIDQRDGVNSEDIYAFLLIDNKGWIIQVPHEQFDSAITNKWNHVVVIQDGITPKMYVNGKQVGVLTDYGTGDKTVWFDDLYTANNAVDVAGVGALRRYGNNGQAHFNGNIDDVKIYNKVLTTDEIIALYNQNINVSGNDIIFGEQGNDSISGGAGDDKLYGGDGNDVLEGGQGKDILDGGVGTDTITYQNSSYGVEAYLQGTTKIKEEIVTDAYGEKRLEFTEQTIYGIGGDAEGDIILNAENLTGSINVDKLTGTDNENEIQGLSGDDIIYGLAGDDKLYGGIGDDIIEGGQGADIIDGGEGDDTISYQNSEKGVIANLSTGIVKDSLVSMNTAKAGFNYSTGDTFTNIENLIGSKYDDNITGDSKANVLAGLDGNDKIIDNQGNDIIFGGKGDDVIYSGKDNDQVDGGEGNDNIYGGLGRDTLVGGKGDDLIFGYYVYDLNLENSLVADYSFSGNANDASGNLNNGIINGATLTTDRFGNANSAYSFDGNDYITLGNNSSLKPTNNLTINVWVKPSATQLSYADILGGHKNSQGYVIQQNAENINQYVFAYRGLSTDAWQGGQVFIQLKSNEWQNLVITKEDNHIQYFLNGTKIGEETTSDAIIKYSINESVYVGHGYDATRSFNGSIDDVQIYDKALTAEQIQTLYNDNGYIRASNLLDNDSSQNDIINGDDGNDRIFGGQGKDQISGGAGNDIIFGQQGDDELYGNQGDDIIYSGLGDDQIFGGDDNDIIFGEEGDDKIYGETGDDKIFGAQGNDTISGGYGNDLILGDDGDDVISGEDGNDILYGGKGSDIINGGAGDDILYANQESLTVSGVNLDENQIIGGDGNDKIYGDTGNDRLYGGDNDDIIYGFAGDDLISGGAGSNILYGGEGKNTFLIMSGESGENRIKDFIFAKDKVNVSTFVEIARYEQILPFLSQDGANVKMSLSGGQTVVLENVNLADLKAENFIIQKDKTIDGDEKNNVITGNFGNDTIDGQAGDDIIYGKAGDDTLIGGVGADTLDGGDGKDWIDYTSSNESVTIDLLQNKGIGGDAKGDVYISIENIRAGRGNDLIKGNDADNVIEGRQGNDTIYANAGNDTIAGEKGNDTLYGGEGDDIYIVNAGDGLDTIIESGAGKDVLYLGKGIKIEDVSFAKEGNDLIVKVSDGNNIRLSNHYLNNIKVETLEFADGHSFDLNNIQTTATDAMYLLPTAIAINEDGSLSFDVNDLYVGLKDSNEGVFISKILNPKNTHGSISLVDGQLVYKPTANYNGIDNFICDLQLSNNKTVSVNINLNIAPLNDAPVMDFTETSLYEDTSKILNILGQASDVDGDSLSLKITENPYYGKLEILADKTVKYTPNLDYTGEDSFLYTISDGHGGEVTKKMNLNVIRTTTDEDNELMLDLISASKDVNDDPFIVSAVINGAHGKVSITPQYMLTPTGMSWTDAETWAVSMGGHLVTINSAEEQLLLQKYFGGAENFWIGYTDQEKEGVWKWINGETSTYTHWWAGEPNNCGDEDYAHICNWVGDGTAWNDYQNHLQYRGIVEIENPTFTYIPDENYNGTDKISYKIFDGNGGEITKNLTINVNSINDAPEFIDLKDNLASYYDFSGNANDDSGNGNNGIVNGAILTTDRFGNADSAYYFDGVDDYIKVLDSSSIDIVNDITMSAWVQGYQSNGIGAGMIMSKHNTNWSRSYALYQTGGVYGANPGIQMQLDDQNNNGYITNPYQISNQDWHFIGATYSKQTGDMKFYVDGELVTTTHIDSIDLMQIDIPFVVGAYCHPSGIMREFYKGIIDDIELYNKALTSDEISNLYHMSSSNISDLPSYLAVKTDEDTAIKIDILRAYTDADGDGLNISHITNALNGTASIVDNKIVYTPTTNYNGTDKITYTISDGKGGEITKDLIITVNSVNDAPTATITTAITNEDNTVAIDVLSGANDVDCNSLTISKITQGTNGTVEIKLVDDKQQIIYTPTTNYNGTDKINYTISDGNGGEITKELIITVNSVNDAPTATITTATTNEDNSIIIDVLTGATDVDNDILKISGLTNGSHGKVEIVNNVSTDRNGFEYNGSMYYLSEDFENWSEAEAEANKIGGHLVTINDLAEQNFLNTTFGLSKNLWIGFNDIQEEGNWKWASGENVSFNNFASGEPNNYAGIEDYAILWANNGGKWADLPNISSWQTGGMQGIIEVKLGQNIKYTPDENYNGTDKITYTISDGKGVEITKDLTITVNPVNDAPEFIDLKDNLASYYDFSGNANDDSGNGNNALVTGAILTTDRFGNADSAYYFDGIDDYISVGYNKDQELFNLTEEFTYSFWVNNVNGYVISREQSFKAWPSSELRIFDNNICVALNYQDAGNFSFFRSDSKIDFNIWQNITYSYSVYDEQLKIYLNGEHVFETTYDKNIWSPTTPLFIMGIPKGAEGGWESFSKGYMDDIQIYNKALTSDEIFNLYHMSSSNISDLPSYLAVKTDEDTAIKIDILRAYTDADGDGLNISHITNGLNGTASIVDNKIVYTPTENYNGTDKISYTISDSNGGEITKELEITVTSVNDSPIIAQTIQDREIIAGNSFDFTLGNNIFKDADGDILTYTASLADGTVLPDWLRFDALTKEFKGESPSGDSMDIGINITASDGQASIHQTFNLKINTNIIQGTAENDSIIGTDNNDIIYGNGGLIEYNFGHDGSNIVKNGSFEETQIAGWGVYRNVNGWNTNIGPGIEIENGDIAGIRPSDGNQKVELDSHDFSDISKSNSNMYQDIWTKGEGDFQISLDYTPRPWWTGETSQIGVYWNGEKIDTLFSNYAGWETKEYKVQGSGEYTRLEFRAEGTSESYGGFLDNIKVIAEPIKLGDILDGGSGNDEIHGGDSSDTIIGGLGTDILYGGSGNDLFDFSTLSDSTENNMDTIMDFEQGHDKLDFTGLGFDESDIGRYLIYEIVNGDTIIHDTESEFAVKLHGEHQLLASDYIL